MAKDTLETIIARMETGQKFMHEDIIEIKNVMLTHIQNDKNDFAAIRNDLASLNKFAASIAIVAGSVGAIGTWVLKKVGVI